MEAVTESSTTNSMDTVVEVPAKEVDGMGVPEEVSTSELTSEKNGTDKELSWEKIAAEIAAEEEPKEEKNEVNEPTSSEPIKEETVEETVINTVTEEKIVTEADSSEVIEKPIEVTPEPPVEAEPIVEKTTPTAETIPVDEVTEVPEVSETTQVGEVIEISEETEIAAPPEPVEEIIEPPTEVIEPPEEVKPVEPPKEEEEKTQTLKIKEHEVVEITEVKPNESVEVTETIDEIEYTVLDPEEVETHEIIEEHLAQSNSSKGVTETVVIINPDQSQTEITIQQVDDDRDENQYTEEIYVVSKENEGAVDDPGSEEAETKPSKPKKQRGRKPIADIPLHVLGRDITKPTEGVSNGGRTMPKPRLGVKVPYRNLTSQIVSKQEIEKEIMERFKLKQEQNASNSGDILFARKLTQRLAKKLIPSEKDKDKNIKQDEEEEPSSSNENPTSEIKNNSDLIAILEGEGDDIDLTQQKKEEVKKTEKEIALEQLKELPGKNKVHKKEEEKKAASPQKEAPKVKAPAPVTSPQKPVEKKSQVEVEPRLKTGMVIKTYTRKRKSTDMEPILPPKKAVVAATTIKTEDGSPSNVYMTKSSRVIKRKVIWDPDEAPSKSPLKAPKIETPSKPSSPVKSVEKKETVEKIPEKRTPSPTKKVVTKSPIIKKPKRLTEIDRLLMDEGAVNMLYDVKTNEETSPDKLKKKTNKNVISLDKAHKELMSKTNVIKNDLQQNTNKDVQKSLRKKEIASPPTKKEVKKEVTPSAITRKKSKDSVRSSVHTPPSSPPYNAAEASRIIRRHSSSSFSSNAEFSDEEGEEKTKKKAAESKKKVKKTDGKPVKEATKNNNNTVTEKVNHVDKTPGQYKSFTVTKKNKLVSIKLQSADGKCYLNEQVLHDLISCLKDFGKDNNCHVVSITSDNNESFCEGLDYRLLVVDDDGARKKKANEVASLVKEFLRCLLNFPKVIVAGIQGDCVGLGVTMLPLFDMVIASDTSTFRTPYSRLGCVPEAGFLLTVPHLSSNGLASELFYTSQTIKADDAFRRGLVTRLCWPEKYQQELKSMLSQIANQSIQSIMATKQQLRQNIMETTESSLSSISKVLVEYWTSPECQKNFSK